MPTLSNQPAEPTRPLAETPLWLARSARLWERRTLLWRVLASSLTLSLAIAFAIPKQYKSTASIMPPDQQGTSAMMLAALAGRGGSGLGAFSGLAGSLLGVHSSTALFIDLLRSGTVSGHLIDRFDLQKVYAKRYRVDTAKYLAKRTKIADDKKSGVITISVLDTDPIRARDITQAYLDELNELVIKTNTSTAHQERIFIERRLQSVNHDLEKAQVALSEFSSRNSTIDLKEQTRAMVDASAKLQGEILVEQSGLESLRQLYGDSNTRIRQAEARIGSLQSQLNKMAGSNALASTEKDGTGTESSAAGSINDLYPPLRQLPRLAVPYADLYRRVRVQETVYELLTQQYEMSRIEEAKDTPAVNIIDAPGIPEKKSYPPRLLLALAMTTLSMGVAAAWILLKDAWTALYETDPRKVLARSIWRTMMRRPEATFIGSEP